MTRIAGGLGSGLRSAKNVPKEGKNVITRPKAMGQRRIGIRL